ncbi:MAG: UPF0489 family protein [Candidatus Aminicenantaceae bacterium]
MKKRASKRVPIYIFDEHDEAFYFWHKAKYEGYLKEPLDLFHVDGHDDMNRVEKFERSIYFNSYQRESYLEFYENFVKKELNNASFIFPAILNGLIKDVYFIYPKWRNFKPRRKQFTVASAFGEGKILKYGIKVDKHSDPRILKALPDMKCFNFHMLEVEGIPKNRKVILDIDLDYFACRDSISNNVNYSLEITKEQFLKKEAVLKDKSLRFSGLLFHFFKKNKKYYVRIERKKVKDMSYLPTTKEIESSMNNLMSTLVSKNTKPIVITISRSCISGHCPNNYFKSIETKLKQKLALLLDS